MAQASTMSKVSDRASVMVDKLKSSHYPERIIGKAKSIPSDSFVGLALGSMVISGFLALFSSRRSLANFVGLWAPSLLLLGIYNKLIKSDESRHAATGPNERL